MSFYSGNFSFNGVSNEDMGVMLVNVNSEVLMDYGIKYTESMQTEMSKNNHFYYSKNSEVESITINVALVNKFNEPKTWTLEDRMKVIDWLVTKDFCSFISEDNNSIVYYFKCIEYTKKFNHKGQGIIEFIMQPESRYVYTPIIEHTYSINNEREFTINCLDNVNEKYYPRIEVSQFSKNAQEFVIQNISTNNEPFIIKNLEFNEVVEVDHLLKSVSSNLEVFRIKDLNRKWFYLKRGLNYIKVSGNCDMKITTQYPLKV